MKKLLALLLLVGATIPAFAGPHGHGHGYWHRGHGHGNNWNWMAPALIGGVIAYEISRNQPTVVVQPPPVVVQNPSMIVQQQQSCSPWTEIQNLDGTVTRTRTCSQ